MIIITSNLLEQDWEKVYGVYLLAETTVPIPWYIKKWGLNYLAPPAYLPTKEGTYGRALSPNLHKMRVCLQGQRWAEVASPELIALVNSVGLNQTYHIGGEMLDERMLLTLIGINW